MAITLWYQAVHLTKRFRLGTEKKAMDGSRWIYGKGVTSNAVGAFVVFNDNTFTPILMTSVTPSTGIVGVSASANTVATSFSWYMVFGESTNTALKGLVSVLTTSVDKGALFQSGTAGAVTTTASATKLVTGAWAIGVSSANLGDVQLAYPAVAGTSTV